MLIAIIYMFGVVDPRVTFSRAYQQKFSVRLWAGLLGNHVVSYILPILQIMSFLHFYLTGEIYAHFLAMELSNLLGEVALVFQIRRWFQHDEAPANCERKSRPSVS